MMPVSKGDKIKIYRIIGRLVVGGPAIHAINLNLGMNSNRFESVLVCGIENPGEHSLIDDAHSRGLKPLVIPEVVSEANLKPRDIKALLKLYRLFRREQPHIVHTHTAKAGFIGRLAACLARVPIVVHTYHGHILHGYYSPFKSWILRRMERILSCLTDRLIAVSGQVKSDLICYHVAPPEKIVVIPLGLELKPFVDCDAHGGAFRNELGLNNGHRLVGIVGRMVPVKNHRLFLDAAASVAAEEPVARFVVVGDGPLRQDMEQHALALGIGDRVLFTGWRRDMPKIYADLDVLVVSSNNEGTPVSAIEAMAARCPVVATRVGGVPDLVRDGETGYLVPAEDAEALSAAILRILEDPQTASRMAKTARAIAVQRFNTDRLIADIERLYVDLLKEKQLQLASARRFWEGARFKS
jgi:glycosyltransferase involved in cell wall biosynthesis